MYEFPEPYNFIKESLQAFKWGCQACSSGYKIVMNCMLQAESCVCLLECMHKNAVTATFLSGMEVNKAT